MKAAKKPDRPGLWPLPLLAAAVMLTAGCGGRVYLYEVPEAAATIAVDGKTEDWAGALSLISEDHVSVGFANDRDFLYLCVTRERSGERTGASPRNLTVWLDPGGGTKKAMGIRVGGTLPPMDDGGPEGRPPRGEEAPPAGFEVLDANGQVVASGPLGQATGEGLEVASHSGSDRLVIEMKVPLGGSGGSLIAIGRPGSDVGVGVLAEAPKRQGRPDGAVPGGPSGGGGMPGGGGMTGGMGGGPGGQAGGMRPGEPDLPKPLKIWIKVRLREGAGHAVFTWRAGS